MEKKFIFFIIIVFSLLSLLIFPRIYEKEKKENVDLHLLYDAKNLCIALCEHFLKNSSYDNVCLSDEDTISGKYWRYKNISCYIGNENPCLEKSSAEIILYNNCSIKEINLK